MSELIKVLNTLPIGVLVITVVILILLVGGLFKLTYYFAKTTAEKILNELTVKIDKLVGKVELIEINTKASHTALTELFNGEYKERFEAIKTEMKDDARFIRSKDE